MKRAGKLLGLLAVLIVVGIAALALLFDTDQFRPRAEAALTRALHRETHIGKLSLSVLHGRIEADGLTVAEDPAFGKTPFIQAKSVGLHASMWDLIVQRKLNVTGIVISEPLIALLQDPRGVWNYATLGSPASPGSKSPAKASPGGTNDLSIAQLQISAGRLTINKTVLENVEITARDISPIAAFPFTAAGKLASGGDFRMEGKAGPIPSGDASKIPVQLTTKVQNLKLDSYGIGGSLFLDGQGSSDGRNLDWAGNMRIDQAKFVTGGSPAKVPLALDIGIRHSLESHTGTLTRGTLHIGKADAALSGSYTMHGQNDFINLHISGKAMPMSDLEAVLPAFDIQLPAGSLLQGGTVTADLTAAGDADQPAVAGVIDVANTKLGGFNLGEKLAVIERLAGIRTTSDTEIEKLHTRLRRGPSGTTVEELDLLIPAIGELTGAGTITPPHALHFKMRAAVKGTGAALGVVPFVIEGTANNPVFRPDAAAILTEELQRFGGKNVGGVDTGNAIDAIKSILGHKKQ